MPRSSSGPTAKDLFLEKLRAVHARVVELEREHDRARQAAKAAKRRLEAALDSLHRLIDLGPEQLALFDREEQQPHSP